MTTAREIMTPEATFVDRDPTVADAAAPDGRRHFGALPVCNARALAGVVTDRDLVVRCSPRAATRPTKVADRDERTEVVTIGADDTAEEAIRTMKDHAVRRLPVIDGTELVGMVSQADIARAMPDAKVGDLVGAISDAPGNSG